jgi:opacity protein-like surface antigen
MNIVRTSIVLLLLLPAVASAQTGADSVPVVEIFGGYSYLRTDINPDFPFFGHAELDKNMHGWNASATVNINKWLGVEADFSGHYGPRFDEGGFLPNPRSNLRQHHHTFLFGPKFTVRNNSRFTPYAHIMFGLAKAQVLIIGLDDFGGATDKDFAMAMGGGVDIKLGDRIAIRPAQVDYIPARLFSDLNFSLTRLQTTQDNLRLSTGIVINFGRR